MPTFPAAFGNPNAGFSEAPDASAMSSKMDSGEYRQQRDRRGRREVFSIALTLESFRLAMFNAWFKYKVAHGKTFFDIDLPDGQDGFTTRSCRFTSSNYSVSLLQLPLLWSVQFEVESFS